MNGILLGLASHFVGPVSGLLTTPAMDFIDDVIGLTATWPDLVKRCLVLAIASVLPTIVALAPTLHLSMNPADLLTRPEVQSVIGFVVALLLKSHNNQAKAKPPSTGSTT